MNLPALRPACSRPGHGFMTYRPGATREQRWCGTWYECSDYACGVSVLLPSPELIEQWRQQGASPAQLAAMGAAL